MGHQQTGIATVWTVPEAQEDEEPDDVPRSRVRVLIADDHPKSRAALRALLTTVPGIEIVGEASDGREAVRLVERLDPTVVLMDIQMPGTNGLEAARRIKAGWPEVRVVMLTCCADYRSAALAAGADGFLVKGSSVDALIALVAGEPVA